MDTISQNFVENNPDGQRKEFLSRWPWRGPLVQNESMRDIVSRIAAQHHLTVEELRGHSRIKKLAYPRFQVMYEIRLLTKQSYPAIGRFLGGRDHTSIMAGRKRHAEITGLPL